jgi:GTPase
MKPQDAPLVAIVGRPNVGKSTLFNRFVGGRPALVDDRPGVTRDRRYGQVEYFGRHLRIVDTGGLDPDAERDAVGAGIHRQARAAIDEAVAILFVVDGFAGVTPVDRELAVMLRRLGKPVLCAVNKVDGPKRDALTHEFHELGMGALYGVSAAHGRGVDELLDALVDTLGLPGMAESAPPASSDFASDVVPDRVDDSDGAADGEPDGADRGSGPLRIAFVGKPNAGKSSLVNRLVGTERSLVHDQPGTTMDPVDTPFSLDGRDYVLVDTAGMRRRPRIEERAEQVSVSMAMGQIRRADLVVLVVDAVLGPTEQDARIARAAADAGRALVIALNKMDQLGPSAGAELRDKLRDELEFVSFAPVVMLSALRGDGIGALMAQVDQAAIAHRQRVPTAELNQFFAQVCETHPPPTHRGRSVRVHYLTQGGIQPPTFLLFANRPTHLAPTYKRFLVNQLRRRYGFAGTPVRIVVKGKGKGSAGQRSQRARSG